MVHRPGVASAVRRSGTALGPLAAVTAIAEYAPSVVALGQWAPFAALPGELCRWRGPRFPARVALTFDDGPDTDGTPRVLDALDELELRATFFVLGERARRHADLVDEIARRGHQLATHGDEHARHLLRSPAWVRRDLKRARDTMAALGHPPNWYRPSYGQATGATLLAARAVGLRTVLWSSWGREWTSADPRRIAACVARRLQPGAVVLLHDSDVFGAAGMARAAVAALPLVAEHMRRRRLAAVTMDELVA